MFNFSLSESQKDCWRFVVQNAPDGVLKRIDQGLLTAYVVACDMHRVAAVQQEKMDAGSEWPLLVRSPRDGTLTMSPYVRMLSRTGAHPAGSLEVRKIVYTTTP